MASGPRPWTPPWVSTWAPPWSPARSAAGGREAAITAALEAAATAWARWVSLLLPVCLAALETPRKQPLEIVGRRRCSTSASALDSRARVRIA